MIIKQLSLYQKMLLLCKVLFIRCRIIRLIWIAKSIELNDYARAKFDEVEWQEIFGMRYKRIADSTGEYRFYVPAISEELAWRIDESYSLGRNNKLPVTLGLIVNQDGLRDEQRYREVWEDGKTY